MVKLRFLVTIEKDFQTVWAYFSQFSNIVQWDPNTRGCEVKKQVEGKVGSIYNITSVFNGSESLVLYTTQAYSKTQKEGYISLFGQNDMIRALDQIKCKRMGINKTQLEYKANISLKGIYVLFTPLIIRGLNKLTESARVGCINKSRQLWGKAE